MSERIYLNNNWIFNESFSAQMLYREYDASDCKTVRIPHTVKELPFNYFDESLYKMVSGYRKVVAVPAEWKGSHISLTFEGVAHKTDLYLNGELVKQHFCGYTAFSIDVTDRLIYGEENVIALKVDSTEELNQPPFGHVIDYMTFGGIYRDVYFEITPLIYIKDVFHYADFGKNDITLISEINLENIENSPVVVKQLLDGEEINTELCNSDSIVCKVPVENIERWDIDNPKLYSIITRIVEKENGKLLDEKVCRFGFRKSEFKADGYYLNDKKVKIRGLNRHQSYPYIGYAAPDSMQETDAVILKEELGVNAVRTSHYPQSQAFIDKCDELGLLVFTEIPGWQYIGDSVWKDIAVKNVEDMVLQYRNHPSIILWGVRINESVDDDDLYRKTNEVAHSLDPTRQTGGVRAHKKSHFFEDVYTYNDFLHSGRNRGCEKKKNVTPDSSKAYLVSEYNGHMFPTKNFDSEEHRREHAIRHANVLDAIAKEQNIAGSFGWCMFDYNTHKDFGSGDRICYHGVLDMFRNPKKAAYVYACEQEDKPVLELSSSMDIGEHPGCNRGLTWIFSNADSVRMYKQDLFIKEYVPQDSQFKNLKHGPILIDDFIGDLIEADEEGTDSYKHDLKFALNAYTLYGMNLPKVVWPRVLKLILIDHMNFDSAVKKYNKYIGDWGGKSAAYRFEAIKDGKIVKTLVKEPAKSVMLNACCSSNVLTEAKSYDMALVRISAVDENGNRLDFFNEPVLLETEGCIELVGEKIIGLKGGAAGALVKTCGKAGKGVLKISNASCKQLKLEFVVNKEDIKEM